MTSQYSLLIFKGAQGAGWWMAPPALAEWRSAMETHGEDYADPTGIWKLPMFSVISWTVAMQSQSRQEMILWTGMGLYGEMLFTVMGQSPACGTVLKWLWEIQAVQPEKQPLLFAQVRQEWAFTGSATSDQSSICDVTLPSKSGMSLSLPLSYPFSSPLLSSSSLPFPFPSFLSPSVPLSFSILFPPPLQSLFQHRNFI